ncbi:LysR family transcriptional regulator [Thalassotalea sp. LPB0316]|uniref:LysR family transcriptional regulator n=1 Tax=Thalassotalea sp. LPB0316 TaxID=2769490 RepID=UPI001867B56F|nr:LysR family transcriptional regulator [Thalassotalea sp. LPB0316]QOL25337.1 LysR family transcriptional regulator [Thalassotalea sp. LPB0316]
MDNHKKLERLMLFHEVAKDLSFTKAAERLAISKSHLSLQIKKLEQEMNVALLVRSTRSVKLTEQGQAIARQTQDIQGSLIDIERSVNAGKEQITGVIKLTAPLLFTQAILLNICQKFKQRYAEVSFAIDCSYTPHDLHQSDYDLAFRATSQPPQNMVARALLPYQTICYASPSYLAENGTPTSVDELTLHQCLAGQDQRVWQFKSGEVPINGWLQLNDNNLLKNQAVAGSGIVKIPDYFAKKEVALGELLPLLQHQSLQERTIYLLYPQVIFQSKKLKTFIEFVFDEIKYLKHVKRDS